MRGIYDFTGTWEEASQILMSRARLQLGMVFRGALEGRWLSLEKNFALSEFNRDIEHLWPMGVLVDNDPPVEWAIGEGAYTHVYFELKEIGISEL